MTDSFFPPADLAAAFSCPGNQYLYAECSTCFAVSRVGQDMNFGAASNYCRSGGGNLIAFNSTGDISRLVRFLEGLREDLNGFWVGLRFISNGTIVDTTGITSTVVSESSYYFAPGDPATGCVGIREGSFFTRACSELQRFICAYAYSGEFGIELHAYMLKWNPVLIFILFSKGSAY